MTEATIKDMLSKNFQKLMNEKNGVWKTGYLHAKG